MRFFKRQMVSSFTVEILESIFHERRKLLFTSVTWRKVVVTRVVGSMTENLRPTRVEATNVANVVLDGGDAILLGVKTLRGLYPVETISIVGKICVEPGMDRHNCYADEHYLATFFNIRIILLLFSSLCYTSFLNMSDYKSQMVIFPGTKIEYFSRTNIVYLLKVNHFYVSELLFYNIYSFELFGLLIKMLIWILLIRITT